MLEYFEKTVRPEDKKWWIKHCSKFGWVLKTSHKYSEHNNYHIGTTINGEIIASCDTYEYVTLTFARYKNIPNHDQLVQLQREYDAIMYDVEGLYNTDGYYAALGLLALIIVWCIVACIISLFPNNFMGSDPSYIPAILIVIAFFVIIFLLVLRGLNKKENKEIVNENQRRRNRRAQIYKTAQSLLR